MVNIGKEVAIVILAATVDRSLGDPRILPHPVQIMGWIIANYTRMVIVSSWGKIIKRTAGVCLAIGSIATSGIIAYLIIARANQINFFLGASVEIIILASCFAGRSLHLAAKEVLQPLSSGDLEAARAKLDSYVGRDTQNLSRVEILRAVLETVAENTTDGVTAPLFYAILGAIIPGVGSAPLAIAYKAASTLDSMVGYKKEPYIDLGWFSARLEDGLTWLPCRLTVLTIALLSGKPKQVWHLCRRDGIKDPSPNSGWSECAYAAALGVQLGGTNYYDGVVKEKPLLGDRDLEITIATVESALGLMRNCFLLWLAIGSLILVGQSTIFRMNF
ncbi:MAG: adenosylcobinamide-phosphate synthase CbiB [Prochloraceae cyanobacterium]